MEVTLNSTQSAEDESPVTTIAERHDWRRPALIGLLAVGVAVTIAEGFHVVRRHGADTPSIYGVTSIAYVLAATGQLLVRPREVRGSVRMRWALWTGFLMLIGFIYCLALIGSLHLLELPHTIQNSLYGVAYGIAYIITVNPPRPTVWRRLWLVDAGIAAVVGTMFFLVYQHGEPAGVYTGMMFSIAVQGLFAIGSLLSWRASTSAAARTLAQCMTVFFLVRLVLVAMCNTTDFWWGARWAVAANVLYPVDGLVVCACSLYLSRTHAGEEIKGKPLPPASTVLITAVILLACLPLLHWNLLPGMILLVVAVTLFALQVSLLQSDFEHERTSLLQGNRELRQLAYTDPLTGVANRRRILETMEEALKAARAGAGPAALVLFDLDPFPETDATVRTTKHEMLLCRFAETVMTNLKPPPTHFARRSSSQFLLVIEGAGRHGGQRAVEQLQTMPHSFPIPFSAGVATVASFGPETVMAWLARADADLLRSKGERALSTQWQRAWRPLGT
jgi:diguanylate cyclase (GGDEF)-like protein